VVLHGETLYDCRDKVDELIATQGRILVHPYDDAAVMAGQGTIALEMLAEVPDLDMLVIPIGGGGLCAGNAISARAVKPDIRIVGVEAALYPSFVNAIRGEERPIGGPTLAEGIAVKSVGQLTLPVVRDLVEDILLVDEAAIESGVNAYATLARTMAEGAGAAGLAAMLAFPERFRGLKVGLILCGGNIDARLLAAIMVRSLERDQRIFSFRVTMPDRPGLLGGIASRLGELGANILEVSHGRLFLDVPAKGVSLDLTIETRGGDHTQEIIAALAGDGLDPQPIDRRGVLKAERG
jgi:threonine dehydratase